MVGGGSAMLWKCTYFGSSSRKVIVGVVKQRSRVLARHNVMVFRVWRCQNDAVIFSTPMEKNNSIYLHRSRPQSFYSDVDPAYML